jgi:hypothetical protein
VSNNSNFKQQVKLLIRMRKNYLLNPYKDQQSIKKFQNRRIMHIEKTVTMPVTLSRLKALAEIKAIESTLNKI